MKVEYNNLYTHFIFITSNRLPIIEEIHRIRIEKYITGIVNNNGSKLYAIYANPEHVHFLVSRSPKLSEEALATIVAESSERFINETNFAKDFLHGSNLPQHFLFLKLMWIKSANTYLDNLSIIAKKVSRKSMSLLLSSIKKASVGNKVIR